MSLSDRRGLWITLGVVLAVAAAGLSGAAIWRARGADRTVADNLASGDGARMRAALLSVDPEELRGDEAAETRDQASKAWRDMSVDDMLEMSRRDDLTEEQRQRLQENMFTLMQTGMTDAADAFLAKQMAGASKEELDKLLDEQLDEWEKFRAKMEEFRERQQAEDEANGKDPEARREEMRRRWQGSQTVEERKKRMEGGDMERMAKMMNYFAQVRARAAERGIDMGRWGPPGRGDGNRDRGDRDRDGGRRPPNDNKG